MTEQLFQQQLIVKKSAIHGYGVFAGKDISKGELIEECQALIMDTASPELMDFYFHAGPKQYALALGYGSLYNHSAEPNAQFVFIPDRKIIEFHALKAIRSGEEILIYYGQDWFSNRNMRWKKLSIWRRFSFYLSPIKSVLMRGVFAAALLFLLIELLAKFF